MTDATHLTNFFGGKKALPVYLTIGNIHSEIRRKPSEYATAIVAFIPVPPKQRKMTAAEKRAYDANKTMIINNIYADLFAEISVKNTENGFDSLCPDGLTRRIFPRLAAWLGDYPEHCDIQGVAYTRCLWCELPKHAFGDNTIGADRNHGVYHDKYHAGSIDYLKEHGMTYRHNWLWDFCRDRQQIASIVKPDILHTLLLGLIEHLMEWIISIY